MRGSLEVLDGGLFTTIQDAGRAGYRKYGIPVSGVIDSHSYKLANKLVGNPEDAPVLEMTLQGGRYRFLSDAVMGISGADMKAKLNEQSVEINRSIFVKEGEELAFGFAKTGCRCYLSIRGLWKVDKMMESCSTYTAANFGGFKGRSLKQGDKLEWEFDSNGFVEREIPRELIPYFSSGNRLRVIAGPEWEMLSEDNQKLFLSSEFKVASESNRMGIRLEAEQPLVFDGGEMISSPVIPGIIQLPKNGTPIILMQDGQTIGGYPRIAKVADADLWRAGQLAPRNTVSLEMISVDEAKELSRYQEVLFHEF